MLVCFDLRSRRILVPYERPLILNFPLEIIKVPKGKCPWEAAEDMVKRQPGKFRQIGSGMYAEVYGSAKYKHVYKIGDYDEDDGYIRFLREMRKLPKHNPYFPVIYGMRIFQNGENSCYVVAMERLVEIPHKHRFAAEMIVDIIEDLFFNRKQTFPQALELLGVGFKIPPDILTALGVIKKANRKDGYDIHTGNIMLRGSQLVITDPLT